MSCIYGQSYTQKCVESRKKGRNISRALCFAAFPSLIYALHFSLFFKMRTAGWKWGHLTLVLEFGGLRAKIQGEDKFASWKELGFKPVAKGKIQGPLQILIPLANGGRMTQRRVDVNDRQKIRRASKVLCALFKLEGDPFRKFNGGWEIVFHVEIDANLRQSRAAEEPDYDDEKAIPTGKMQFNPEDLGGFSTFST